MFVKARRCRAYLTSVEEFVWNGLSNDVIEINVVEDNGRRMPAELHRQLFDTISRQSSQLLADPCRSGERHLANDRGCEKAIGYFRRVAKNNGHRTTGTSRTEESSSHFQGGQRHLFVGLDDAGTAGGKSGCDLAAWNEGWEGPLRE